MFLPTEGLYAEILRRPGLVDGVQREHRILITGPTTLAALLNSLQMAFARWLLNSARVRFGNCWAQFVLSSDSSVTFW